VILNTSQTIYEGNTSTKVISLSSIKGFSCILLIVATISKKTSVSDFVTKTLDSYFERYVEYPHLTNQGPPSKSPEVAEEWKFVNSHVQPRPTQRTVVFIITRISPSVISGNFQDVADLISVKKIVLMVVLHYANES